LPSKPVKDSGFTNSLREVGPYLGLGLQLAITIVVMVLIGDWLDKRFNQKYIFTLIFGILGIGVGIYNLIKTVNDLDKKNKNKDEVN
jgi:F0F1-type ATP synthase assembly protein I